MINLIAIVLVFILLVTQKILLLNEESLILLCFITFTVLGLNNLHNSVNNSLETQSSQIEESLKFSLNQLLTIFNKFANIKQYFKVLLEKFNIVKFYYIKLILSLGNKFLNYGKSNLILSYNQRLIFFNKIENKTIKLLTVVIIKKLNSVIKIKQFYNSSIKITQFLCLNTILIRECIQLINFSSKN